MFDNKSEKKEKVEWINLNWSAKFHLFLLVFLLHFISAFFQHINARMNDKAQEEMDRLPISCKTTSQWVI